MKKFIFFVAALALFTLPLWVGIQPTTEVFREEAIINSLSREVLMMEKGNCIDKSIELKKLLDKLKIKNYIVYGFLTENNEAHTWNKIISDNDMDIIYTDPTAGRILQPDEYMENYIYVKTLTDDEIEARTPLRLTEEERLRYEEATK